MLLQFFTGRSNTLGTFLRVLHGLVHAKAKQPATVDPFNEQEDMGNYFHDMVANWVILA